jgi:hypothetical protein
MTAAVVKDLVAEAGADLSSVDATGRSTGFRILALSAKLAAAVIVILIILLVLTTTSAS